MFLECVTPTGFPKLVRLFYNLNSLSGFFYNYIILWACSTIILTAFQAYVIIILALQACVQS
jgi:hypothetical protein